jgi:hypothetical protein
MSEKVDSALKIKGLKCVTFVKCVEGIGDVQCGSDTVRQRWTACMKEK